MRSVRRILSLVLVGIWLKGGVADFQEVIKETENEQQGGEVQSLERPVTVEFQVLPRLSQSIDNEREEKESTDDIDPMKQEPKVEPVSVISSVDEGPLSWQHEGTNMSSTLGPSCDSFTTCTDCTNSRLCHWCDHDDACHLVGSIHGCIHGAPCQEGPPSPSPGAKNDTAGCTAHTTCSECALASSLCHWCAHDNACHLKGSVYGCVNGVDCYSNDRCKRKEPEPLYDHAVFTQMTQHQIIIVIVVGLICFCGSSLCFCCSVQGAKGDNYYEFEDDDTGRQGLREPLLSSTTDGANGVNNSSTTTQEDTTTVPQGEDSNDGELDVTAVDSSHLVQTEEGHADETAPLATDTISDQQDTVTQHNERGMESSRSTIFRADRRRRRRRQSFSLCQRCLYCFCVTCYLFSTILIGVLVFAAIRFYPKRPEYNVCNDSMAWKSLIDNLAKMKVTADFELLASISNPNNIDVTLDMGHGSFTHEGAFVGTFDIPPVTAKAMSITDMLIIAHLAPEAWDALGLAKEYYQGKLVLHVSVEASVRVPALANFSYTASVDDIVVNVNEMADRHLCACPNWSDGADTSNAVDWLQL